MLRDFNYGYLMELPLNGLKCTCGKPLGHEPDHAICAACGMVNINKIRHHVRLNAINSGKIKGNVHITSTIIKNLRILT